MIRYVSEKQVNFNPITHPKQYYSQLKQINRSRIVPQMSQEEINHSSAALKSLKKINDYKEMIKGRVSVLQIQQQKNDFKAFLNQQKYMFHQNMKEQMDKQKEEKALHLKNLLQKLHQTKERTKSDRRTHQNNLTRAKHQIFSSHRNDFIQKKQKSVEIQKNITEFLNEKHEKKKQRYLMIKQEQKKISNNIEQYKKMKRLQCKVKDSQQIEKVNKIKAQKKKQIDQLAELQTYMIEKQARSKMTSVESQRKLMQLLKGNKNVSTSHTTKLPAINPEQKKQYTEPDMFIV